MATAKKIGKVNRPPNSLLYVKANGDVMSQPLARRKKKKAKK